MKYVKKEKEEKEKFDLQECFTLWLHKGKSGVKYLSGFDFNKNKLVGYFNKKEKDNQPSIRIYSLNEDESNGEEICTLWDSKSNKTGKEYLTGTTNEKEKLIAFFGSEHEENKPYIKGYFKKD